MQTYNLLRYGEASEPHMVAIFNGDTFAGYGALQRKRCGGDVILESVGIRYPRFTMNDLENSTATAAEGILAEPASRESLGYQGFAYPYGLVTYDDVLTAAAYERALRAPYFDMVDAQHALT